MAKRKRPAAKPAKRSTALVRRKPVVVLPGEVISSPGSNGHNIAADGSLQLGALGLTELKLTPKEERVLARQVDPALVQWRASKRDGPADIPYLPHHVYTRWFNEAFGRMGWNLVPVGKPIKTDTNVVLLPYVLHVHKVPVAFAWGEQEYFERKASGEENRSQSYGDVIESTVASALRRCAKHLGVGLELWDKLWVSGIKNRSGRRASPSTPEARRDAPHASHNKDEQPITKARMVDGKRVPGQRERLWVIIRNSGRPETEVRMWLKARFEVDSTNDIKRKDYDYICKAIEHPGPLQLPAFDREVGEEG
jgi:hypothetical protein